ncbi:MAG: flagellin, partial [Balneolaceae bacterium]|nr:flagellin [Balneolaceae bacterium]
SRIMDADFAKEQSESVRLQILQQTSTSALAQANMGPQSVLGFLG